MDDSYYSRRTKKKDARIVGKRDQRIRWQSNKIIVYDVFGNDVFGNQGLCKIRLYDMRNKGLP